MRRFLITSLLCVLAVGGLFAADELPQDLADAYREARVALEKGQAAECVELLRPALADAKADAAQLAPLWLTLGTALVQDGKPADAIAPLEKSASAYAGSPQEGTTLGLLGDALRGAKRADDARRVYEKAAGVGGEALAGRYARARLAQVAGESAEAAINFTEAASKLLEAGDAFIALGAEDAAYLDDARALFETVAKNSNLPPKGWRGEATARAVFSIGEVERARGKLPEAIAYYQRTFVSWTRYPQWPARAYLRAAECMDKLGKRDFAIRHLREMVRKIERYGKLPEYEQAKKQLRAWGEDVR